MLICRICGCEDIARNEACDMVEVVAPPRRTCYIAGWPGEEIETWELPEEALDAMERSQREAEERLKKGIDEERENWKYSRDD
jgi:hypothetical protein